MRGRWERLTRLRDKDKGAHTTTTKSEKEGRETKKGENNVPGKELKEERQINKQRHSLKIKNEDRHGWR